VSVVVAVYNGARYLSSALDSVFAQNYQPLEVIVVDDGSTDGTAAVARFNPAVRYIYQANQGVAAARNTGIAAASGDLIALQDADDLWVDGKLAIQVGYLQADPEADGTMGMALNFVDGNPLGQDAKQTGDRVGLMTLVARRSLYDRVGGYDPAYRIGSDMDWFSRARDAGATIVTLPRILVYRRVHRDNLSRPPDTRVSSLLHTFRASIERKKGKFT
jgi:glycosyltransferase involved in cell wall biosynthesis